MNRSKLTPCRKVGLSRKKNTPLKTVENLLKKENIASQTPKTTSIQIAKKSATPNSIAKSEVNNDTPCRQVGLSRKRKTSTPLNFGKDTIESQARPLNSVGCKIEQNTQDNRTKILSPEEKKNKIKIEEIPKKSKSNVENRESCAKKLSKLFSSPSSRKDNEVKNSPDIYNGEDCTNEDINEGDCDENTLLKTLSDNNLKKVITNEYSSESEKVLQKPVEQSQKKSQELTGTNCDKYKNENFNSKVPAEIVKENNDNSNIISQNDCQFIKVCYSNEEIKTQSKVLSPKKTKFSRELFDDDDDFEIGPKEKKKKKFERSKTEVIKKEKKNKKNVLKKSLSVGDPKSRTFTDSSITSNSSSLTIINDCFVKLEHLKEPKTQKNHISQTQHDHSDDDFETCTPKETKIKNLDKLEKEVEEKRQILEELERAKLHKKMHNIEELKELTAKWKTGCILALQDLLKQLNTHSQMTMDLLLRKLNIPEDLIPLSQ